MNTKPFTFVLAMLVCATALAQQPATQPQRDPDEIRNGIPLGATPQERKRLFYEHLLERIEPSTHGDINHLPQYLDFFRREFIDDPRLFATNLQFQVTGDDEATISGYLEFPEQKSSLVDFFQHLHLPGVTDNTELLPASSLGDNRFGVITTPTAFVYDKPDGPREKLTQCAVGDTIYVLKAVEGQLLCHAPSGYAGYIDAKSVRLINGIMLDQIESSIAVVRGSQIETVIAAAQKYVGVKYVWGANTSEAIDCSGLVFNAFKTIGISMPRDADQQFLVGRLVATRWHRSNLRRGDTLYFLSGRGKIHHTAIYLGDNQFLEATEPAARISSFNPKAPNYAEKRDKSFCFAKRVIE